MADPTDELWQKSRGELIDMVRDLLEGAEDEGTQADLAASRAEVARLVGELGRADELVAEQAEALERVPTVTLETLADAPHLARLDAALGVLAAMIDDDEEGDILQATGDTGETRLAVVASAILSLANARERLTPRPLPPLGR